VEAKWEADFLLKMQDTDGAFYFLVYPTGNSEYESWTPDRNRGQLLYPKNTGVTAAAVAALAEIGSSPAFEARYPQSASQYLAAAVNGWNFLSTTLDIGTGGHGQRPYSGKYQTVIPSFGGVYMHQDSLLWAAAAMFAAGQVGQSGAAVPHAMFLNWLAATHSSSPSGGASSRIWSYGNGQTYCGTASHDSRGIPNDLAPCSWALAAPFAIMPLLSSLAEYLQGP
jgi:hypothetical protein